VLANLEAAFTVALGAGLLVAAADVRGRAWVTIVVTD
jgi:hypothetical protein